MSSAEHSINTAAEKHYNEHNHTFSDEFIQSCSAHPPHKNKSGWSYLKCLVWTAVSGIFNCGHIVLEQPVADQWPLITAKEQDNEGSTVTDFVYPENNQAYPKENIEDTSLTTIHCEPHEGSLIADYCKVSDSKFSENHSGVGVTDDKLELLTPSSPKDQFDETLFTELDTSDYFDTDTILSSGLRKETQISYTLLSAYYADANDGLIDEITRDNLVNNLLQSVIPRNLSDSSEVSISPKTRRMYAWTDPPPNDSNESDTSKKRDQFDLDISSSNSDERLPYPGKLSMSDNSFSPLSPATVESNTVMENCDEPSTKDKHNNDLNLPDVNRHEHTLAWAMANLRTNQGEQETNASTGRPPLPNSLTRQSRDKSPVSTANSCRLIDTQSVPACMVYDGFQLFEDEASNIPKPKRSSSLKSQRTPPGTPGQKVVRFADALGLDLETVRHVFDQENPPKIPASATFDLELDTDESIAKLGAKQFRLCFAQPSSAANFIRRVLDQTVCLEDAHVEMPRGVLIGTIRVRSLGFEKRVFVRATYNDWSTYCDTSASYVQGSHDGATDRFSFSLVFPDTMVPGRRAQFAIRYDAHTGEQFWDNNYGQNYSVMCYAKATDLAGDGSWVHYL